MHDGSREWVWLRAPPGRVAGQGRSKWLRDEQDEDWGSNLGDENYYQQFTENQTGGLIKEGNQSHYYHVIIITITNKRKQ